VIHATHPEREGDVFLDAQVWKQRVMLEYKADVTTLDWKIRDVDPTYVDPSLRRL
jgi:hypothetical protein